MKILLVDDSKSARYALRLQLQRHGVEVETADCAESAFEVLKTQLPDAILMDHMMPGLNGFEALEVIREDPRTAQIPVIMCTSHEEPDFVATANKKGVFGILPKSAAAELIPGILDRLRDSLSSGMVPPVAPSIPATPSASPELSEEMLVKRIDVQVEAKLGRLLTPILEDLRRDLTENLLNESRRLIESRLTAQEATRQSPAPTPTMADFQAMSTRLATETLPDLLMREMTAERTRVMDSVEKHLREFELKLASSDSSQAGKQDANAESITLKAVTQARRESKESIDAAMLDSQNRIQTLEQSLRSAMSRMYLLTTVAVMIGVGAAALVFFILHAPVI